MRRAATPGSSVEGGPGTANAAQAGARLSSPQPQRRSAPGRWAIGGSLALPAAVGAASPGGD
jgi:hypothetical protein